MGGEVEVEERLHCWLKGTEYHASNLYPLSTLCALHPRELIPAVISNGFLEERASPSGSPPSGAGCPPTPHSTKMTKVQDLPLHEPLQELWRQEFQKSEATVREIN